MTRLRRMGKQPASIRQISREIARLEASKEEYEATLAKLEKAKERMAQEDQALRERWKVEAEILGDGCFDKPQEETYADMAALVNKTMEENKELKENKEREERKVQREIKVLKERRERRVRV